MSPLLTDRPQQFGEKSMDLVLDLNEPSCFPPTVTAQRLRDESQPHPFVALTATHGTLSEKNQVTAFRPRVVQELHQLDAVAGHSVTHDCGIHQVLSRRAIPAQRVSVLEIQL